MSKNRFKAGDRVRIMADVEQPYNMWVEKGDTGVIVDGKPAAGFECVKIDGCAGMDYVCIENKYLETDATYDRKTAFLSELKGLLEKYNAQIGCNPVRDDEFEICIDFKDSMVSYPSYIQWLNAGYVSHFKKE